MTARANAERKRAKRCARLRKSADRGRLQPGNSGGPLLDLSGNVVGIVSARINELAVAEATGTLPQNINFAIKSGNVRSFLEANHIDYETAQSTNKLDPADVGESAAKSVVMIECLK